MIQCILFTPGHPTHRLREADFSQCKARAWQTSLFSVLRATHSSGGASPQSADSHELVTSMACGKMTTSLQSPRWQVL